MATGRLPNANRATFRKAMLEIAMTGAATAVESNHYGRKYVVSGILNGANGQSMRVATIWIVLHHDFGMGVLSAYAPGIHWNI